MNTINKELVLKTLGIIDAGLCPGLGSPKPGQMCVMAAINFAMGNEHGDKPTCVHPVVRSFDIRLNDSKWSSNEARAKGMRREAIAKLGSTNIDGGKFRELVAIGTVQKIVPIALRAGAKMNPKFAVRLEAVAVGCESVKTMAEAHAAARQASAEARAIANATYAAADAAFAAANAAFAAANATADAAFAAAERAKVRDAILSLSADIACEALIACGSEGAAFLYLCDQ